MKRLFLTLAALLSFGLPASAQDVIRVDSIMVEVLAYPTSLDVQYLTAAPYYMGDTIRVVFKAVDETGARVPAIVDADLADPSTGTMLQDSDTTAYFVPTSSFVIVFTTSRVNGLAMGFITQDGEFRFGYDWGTIDVGDTGQGCVFPTWDDEVLAASSVECADAFNVAFPALPLPPFMRSAQLALRKE